MRSRRAVSIDELPREAQARVRGAAGAAITLGPDSPLLRSAPRRKRQDLEHPEQAALFAWADAPDTLAIYPELDSLYAIPNWFGLKTKRQGARAKAEGRRAAMPDVVLPVPRISMTGKTYGAMYLELKHLTGSVREAQVHRIQLLRDRGNFVDVAASAEAAKALLLYYLSLPKP